VSTPTPAITDLRALRRQLRAARRAVPAAQRRNAARAIARIASQRHWLRPGRRIALFLSMPEEIDTSVLLQRVRQRGCLVYVPRITNQRRNNMQFLPLTGTMGRGSFGISEPTGGKPLRASHFDLIFMPLVGFDTGGNRIGMGRGYYDRALSFRHRRQHAGTPLLVGLAYDCQQVPALPVQTHDVPLDAILTPSGFRRFTRNT
jgi:5-formyltetrahydrofolate cyclo-ligase